MRAMERRRGRDFDRLDRLIGELERAARAIADEFAMSGLRFADAEMASGSTAGDADSAERAMGSTADETDSADADESLPHF